MAHKSRSDAWSYYFALEQLSDAWLQLEIKSLADISAPSEAKNASSILSALDSGIRQRCKDLGVLSLPHTQMEQEQEREVNRERDTELPPRAAPEIHFLHQDVVAFVKTGVIPPFSPFAPSSRRSSILATTDFLKTIKPESTQGTMDQYLIRNRDTRTRAKSFKGPFGPFE